MDKIEKLEEILKAKIGILNRRIERRSGANFHDEDKKIEMLHGEALAYEKVLEILKGL
jgi:hypothetical protein